MKRRNTIVFFLLLAFSMFQAHNFMPHRHDETAAHTHHHHDHTGAHHHQAPAEDDGHQPFNDVNHSADFGKVLTVPQAGKHLPVPSVALDLMIAAAILLPAPDEIPPPDYIPPDNITFTNLLHYTAVPLRAPPAFIVAA